METLILSKRLNFRRSLILPLYVIAIALSLAGCASSLTRVDLSTIEAPLPGVATIFVIRPSYLSYAARDLTITANNTNIATLRKLSYTSFSMSPGTLSLSGEGGFFSWPRREISLNIEDGGTYYLSWTAKETASSALMLFLFPVLDESQLRWESISKEHAQQLMNSIYYVEPEVQELP